MASADVTRQCLKDNVESELTYIWEDKKIALEAQYKIARAGVNDLNRFTGLEDTRADMKETICQIAGIDISAGDIPSHILAGDLLTCWEEAKNQANTELDLKASAAASSSNIPIPVSRNLRMP